MAMSETKTDSLLEIEINRQKLKVDLRNDHYGAFFWKK
jgi:hypothetical protein